MAATGRFTPGRHLDWWFETKGRMRGFTAVLLIAPVCAVAVGAYGVKRSLIDLPRQYDALEQRGEPMTALFHKCRSALIETTCYLEYPDRDGVDTYPQNPGQFDHLRAGAPVRLLVDPQHRSTRFSVVDVEERTNWPISVLSVFSVAMLLAGIFGARYMLRDR